MKETMREVFYPGFIVMDSNRIPMSDPIPKNCDTYRTVERSVTTIDGESLYGEWKQVGKEIVFGKILTINDVDRYSILYQNMIDNGWDKVVKTKRGTTLVFKDNMEVREVTE